jgi:y4mF family transcriptional regulator
VSPVLAAEERPRLADLALAVRARREDLGLRQAELADLAGVAARTVHAIEAAKATVQLDKLLDVLAALGLHLELARGARPDVAAEPAAKAKP